MSTFALGDLHGRYDLYQKVKEYLRPEDTVVFLGDAADRGPDGWKCIKAIYQDPQMIYLMGNHEHMLYHAMDAITECDLYEYDQPIALCYYNGGENTFEAWLKEGADPTWIRRLTLLPRVYEHAAANGKKIICSHAGFTPSLDSRPSLQDLIWSREHFNDPWPTEEEFKNTYIIHGHTPIPYLHSNWEPADGIICYCDEHKIDIDMGAYAFGAICLLDLDTFEEHYFTA